ncbi:hypothetical protein YC2023_058166 [Brassica napus]
MNHHAHLRLDVVHSRMKLRQRQHHETLCIYGSLDPYTSSPFIVHRNRQRCTSLPLLPTLFFGSRTHERSRPIQISLDASPSASSRESSRKATSCCLD